MDLKSIRQNVFNYLAKQSNNVLLNDCITLIMAEIIGAINSKNADDYGKWKSFCYGIKDYKNLTKEGLLQKIEFEILSSMTINKKHELIEYKPKIYSLDDEYLTFEEGIYDFYKNANVNLRNNYGDKPYTPKLDRGEPKPEKNSTFNITLLPNLNKVLSEEEADLNIFWKKIESEERKVLFPFWKWKINTTEYNELEAKLKAVLAKYKQKDVIERHAFKIALYYAEWYKRKYIGNNSKIDKITDIESIWNNIDEAIRSKYLYTVNISERRDDSLKLLGGLPLSYISSKEKSTNLSLKFSKLFKAINSGKKLNVEDLGLNNQSMNKSAQNGGSIYEFIDELLNEKFPFAESDMELSPFKEFKSFVEGGLKEYKEDKKKKFSINWLVEQHSTFEFIYPFLQIKLKLGENNENHRFISKDLLSKWGIDNSILHFEIIVRLHFKEGSKDFCGYYFNLCANGKFISRGGETWKISFENLPNKPLFIDFILRTEGVDKAIQKEEVPRYIQLWNIEYGVWQSRAKNGKRSAVLFLSENAFTKNSGHSETLFAKDTINYYRWASIDKELVITDNGKDKKLFQKDGCIEVVPKNTYDFRSAIHYENDGKVRFIDWESEKKVYLVKGYVEFVVNYYSKSIYRNKNKIEQRNTDEYFVEYQVNEKDGYLKYTSETELTQGFLKFRISSEPYNEIIECYWLPENATINRDIHSRKITFKEINTVKLSNNPYIDNDDKLDENYIPFKIGVENSYIEINIYRALNRKNDLLIDEKYETSRSIIPIKFADKFTVRAIDTNGLQLYRLTEKIDKYKKIRVIYNNNNPVNNRILVDDKTGIQNEPNLPTLSTYTVNEIEQNNGFYYFRDSANKSIDEFVEYRFYYLPLDSNEPKIIDLMVCEVNNVKFIGFTLNEKTDGIVFQSLKTETFQETYRPFFVSSSNNKMHITVKKEDRATRISKYKDNFKEDLYYLAVNHFNIAVEYNLYFGMFDIFWAMEDNPTLLAKFYLHYYSKMKETGINFNEFHRFAEEFLFDWMLIPRKVWAEAINLKKYKEQQEWILSLFKTKHISDGAEVYALSQCCEKYWVSAHKNTKPQNIFYYNIKRIKKVNTFFILKIKDKIETLKAIDQTTDIYQTLNLTLNN